MTESKQQTKAGVERRSYFRVDDAVRLSIRQVPQEELEDRVDRLDHDLVGNFTVMSSLAAITAQMTVGLRRIENRDPDLAAYLRAIDQKIEVLGRAFITQEPELGGESAVPVNLSAGGMCAGVNENLAAGTPVEVRMLLFPSFTGLLIYGTVVDTVTAPDDTDDSRYAYQSRIEFTHIREQDRELLIRHLLRRQSVQLRDRQQRDAP